MSEDLNLLKDNFWKEVERGKQGLNEGLPMGFDRLTSVICNVQRGRYDLWGGGTGTGKSSAVLDAYVVNPIEYILANPSQPLKLKVKYYNLEMATMPLMAKLMAPRGYEESEGKYLLSVNKIFGRGNYRLSDMLTDYVEFVDGSVSPLFVYKDLMALANKTGKITKRDDGYWHFKPHDPNLIVVVVIDHVGLITPNKDHSGRSIESMDRKSNSHPDPQLSDFKDSGNPAQDADTVISLFNPTRHRLQTHNGYDMNKFGCFYRGISILKNRDGMDNVDIAMGFIGAIGKMKELPTMDELNAKPDLASKVLAYFSNINNS